MVAAEENGQHRIIAEYSMRKKYIAGFCAISVMCITGCVSVVEPRQCLPRAQESVSVQGYMSQATRKCPECKRRFCDELSVCPYDGSLLAQSIPIAP